MSYALYFKYSKAIVFLAFAGLLVGGFAHTAQAGKIVYEQPVVAGANGIGSDFGWLNQVADDFMLGDASAIGTVRWWGNNFYGPSFGGFAEGGGADDFTIRFFGDDGGAPKTSPFFEISADPVTVSSTGLSDAFDIPIFEYAFSSSALPTLPGGETLWISIINDLYPDDLWLWSFMPAFETNAFRTVDGEAWTAYGDGNLAFALETPEPGALPLMLTGLIGVLLASWVHRRRRAPLPCPCEG